MIRSLSKHRCRLSKASILLLSWLMMCQYCQSQTLDFVKRSIFQCSSLLIQLPPYQFLVAERLDKNYGTFEHLLDLVDGFQDDFVVLDFAETMNVSQDLVLDLQPMK